ncbi:MAG: DUF72 domain-containing protein [Spirochaetes bacterium]|nr:DUF72 domain-containing protein [Spirochaetota bacterium]
MAKKYYLGPAGWSYEDWKGVVYPKGMKVHPLNYLEEYFNMLEINTTFYNIPRLNYVEKWCQILKKKDFLFILKLGQKFTHVRTDITPEEIEGYRNVFHIVKYHNRLGGILIQFPWSFINIGENVEYLKNLADLFRDFPLIVEVRHISWHKKIFFEFLNKHNIAFCNIDQPETKNSIQMTDYVTSDIGYFRFHGRNKKEWFAKDTNRDKRYNYLYKAEEIGHLKEKIEKIHEKSLQTFVVGNNHYKGQAVVNLLELQMQLFDKKVNVPEVLASHYPHLVS